MAWSTLLSPLSLPPGLLRSAPASTLLPVLCGTLIGYIVNTRSSTKRTYKLLSQPPFRPPPWVFAPVWTLLYGMMGYTSHRVYSLHPSRGLAGLYTVQLALNFLWMPLFFGLKKPIAAMVDITLLIGCVSVLAALYSDIDTLAAALMVPYLCWLGFAGYLTVGLGMLNGWDIKGAIERAEKGKEA